MTSDKLDDLPPDRADLFANLLSLPVESCRFPELSESTGLITQVAAVGGRGVIRNLFNVSDREITIGGVTLAPHSSSVRRVDDPVINEPVSHAIERDRPSNSATPP
jgi:hypothetical protein